MNPSTSRHERLSHVVSARRARRRAGAVSAGMLLFLSLQDGAAQDAVAEYVSPPDPVTNYLEAIERLESEGGAYSPELADLYLGLGQSLVENQEFEEARNAFHRGVLVVRVNSGPHSAEQTNYLFSIADIESRMGERRAAADVLENIYFINARTYGENSPSMLPVLERMYEWYMTERPLYSPYAVYADFQKAQYLAGRMAVLTAQAKGLGHPDTARIYRTLGQIHFLTIRYALSQGISIEPGVVMSTGSPQPPQIQEVSVREHYSSGREAFVKMVESVAARHDSTSLERAEALAQLGDWYLVFEKYQTARDIYSQAHRMLLDDETTRSLADGYFGEPTPLRFLNNHQDFLAEPPDDPSVQYLEVSMTVTQSGDLRQIEVLNAPDDMSENQLRAIRKQLGETRFRPGLVNGEAMKFKEFLWRHPIKPAGAAP